MCVLVVLMLAFDFFFTLLIIIFIVIIDFVDNGSQSYILMIFIKFSKIQYCVFMCQIFVKYAYRNKEWPALCIFFRQEQLKEYKLYKEVCWNVLLSFYQEVLNMWESSFTLPINLKWKKWVLAIKIKVWSRGSFSDQNKSED